MAAQPIYIETEEEIPELIDRLRRSSSDEVPIVLPARSRLGQSRFNFQLLRHYANQLGKRVAIVSADPAVQRMAEENGLSTFAAVDEVAPVGIRGFAAAERAAAPASAAAPAYEAAPGPTPRPAARPHPVPRPAHVAVAAPGRLMSRGGEAGPARLLLYGGAALLLLVGLAAMFVFVPSADVTLTADAQQFEQKADVAAAPGRPPVRVRVANVEKKSTQSFNVTGQKVTPPAPASGGISWNNKCPVDVVIKNGQRVSGGGQTFAQQGDVPVTHGASGSAQAVAVQPGAAGNVPANAISSYTGDAELGTCLTVTNPGPMGGGADEKRDPQMAQADFDALRATMEQALRKDLTEELGKQSTQGEKLADNVIFQAPDFNTDHRVGDLVKSFSGTMTLRGEGTFYFDTDVKKALADSLSQHVPTGFALTDNAVKSDYVVKSSGQGGSIVFSGTASAFIAPKLDYQQIKGHLAGKSPNAARQYLRGLPVRSEEVHQKPFQLPILPVLGSRIDVKYVVETAKPKTS
jgi:hypothetical protein